MMANNAIILTCGVLLIAPLLVVAKKCTLCPYGPVFLPDGDLSFLFEDSTSSYDKSKIKADLQGEEPTCQKVADVANNFEDSSRVCNSDKWRSWRVVADVCGCKRYNSRAEKVLAFIPRISASLSLFGSSMIIYDVSRDKTKRGCVYHSLMLAMSVFDINSSIAWGLATLPTPDYDKQHDDAYFDDDFTYGAKGKGWTCTAQGFFIQLGFTSMFYNVSLSFYFLMVVRYGMKEFQIRKLRLRLHVPALVLGIALACSGIPFYENVGWGCYIPPQYDVDSNDKRHIIPISIFAVVPIVTAIIIATVNTVLVYWAIRKQMIAARKWRVSRAVLDQGAIKKSSLPRNAGAACALPRNAGVSGESFQPRRPCPQTAMQKMESQTFWRALFYLGAFYVTWPSLLASQFGDNGAQSHLPYLLVVSILGPLEGFLNFLVYAQPQIQKRMKELLQQASRDAPTTSQDAPTTLENTASGARGVVSPEDGPDCNSKKDPVSTELINEMMDMTREESDEESVVDEDVSNEAARVEESSPDAEDVI
jgi:hypothetical protein